jgi:PadR family transcriptional regulator, regulatory protein PadR
MGKSEARVQVLPGTLDMLILRTLRAEARHGHGIATAIQRGSDGALLVDHGSLYPSLQRLERAGLIDAEWGISKNNRRARFYRLTPKGRRKLSAETSRWSKVVRAMMGVMQLAESK